MQCKLDSVSYFIFFEKDTKLGRSGKMKVNLGRVMEGMGLNMTKMYCKKLLRNKNIIFKKLTVQK